ncbi:MAG: hypothetical protein SF052_10560 [Bacteroidia bacterium]|nr:hypothetical protein [Bacteroidia bacterium]
MKNRIIFSMFLGLTLMFASVHSAKAQAHTKGQLGITANVGYSLIGALFQVASVSSEDVGSIPVISGMVDYGVADQFSVGGAVSYQSISVNTTDNLSAEVKNTLSCVNIGIRPLFHFGNSEELDLYAGIRVGYTVWSGSTTSNDPAYEPLEIYNIPGLISVQPLFGTTYYFGPAGINAEIGLGTYIAALGVKVKI